MERPLERMLFLQRSLYGRLSVAAPFDEALPCHAEHVKNMGEAPTQVTPETWRRAILWQRLDLLL